MDVFPTSNQIQATDDDEDRLEELEEVALREPAQETFLSFHNQHFEQPQNCNGISLDAHLAKWHELLSAGAVSTESGHGKIHSQEGLSLASQKLKAKKRRAEIIEVHGGHIIRSAGRKDRHSKVCTARGTRDRRVRLSPKTAIQFYDVQDRLGCDRPSKAIDWLMKEAKSAIDALDERPAVVSNNHFNATKVTENNHGLSNEKNSQMQHESDRLGHLNDHNPVLSFGFFTNGAAPLSSTEFQAYPNDDFNSSISRSEAPEDATLYPSYLEGFFSTPSEIFDTNLEMARLQRIFTWNYAKGRGTGEDHSPVSSLPLHFPASQVLGHSEMFSPREPLQSSTSRTTNCSPISTQFPGISFSNEEILNFTAAAMLKEDEMDKIPASSKPSSTAFLPHYEK